MLTNHMKEAHSIEALLRTYSLHEGHMNSIHIMDHISSCWTSLGQLVRQSTGRYWLQPNAEVMEPLVQHTVQAAMVGENDARELAKIVHGGAQSDSGKSMHTVFQGLA